MFPLSTASANCDGKAKVSSLCVRYRTDGPLAGCTVFNFQLKGGEMLSVWWLLAAFVGGGSAVLVTALMQAMLRPRFQREPGFKLSR